MHPFLAVLMGGITGVGGGTVRDLLLARVPTVLRSDIYAVAGSSGYGGRSQRAIRAYPDDDCGPRYLLHTARGLRLAALEPAESPAHLMTDLVSFSRLLLDHTDRQNAAGMREG